MVTIRRCQAADVADVLAFLDTYWKPGHIFTRHRSLFDWQHALRDRPGEHSDGDRPAPDADDVLSASSATSRRRHFDPSLAADNTVWLALWKIRDDAETAGLGLQLLKFVTDSEPHANIGVMGFNARFVGLYQALGFTVGELRHYVLPNPDVSHFELASFERRHLGPLPTWAVTVSASPLDAEHVWRAARCPSTWGHRNACGAP